MPNLKVVDRIALAAMLAVVCAVPLASRASPAVERRFHPTGPMGTTTLRVDVAADGTIVSKAQVLNDETFQSIRRGMPASEVQALIGPPYRKIRFEGTRTTSWDYHYRDAWGYDAEFSVLLDDADVVVGTFSSRNSGG